MSVFSPSLLHLPKLFLTLSSYSKIIEDGLRPVLADSFSDGIFCIFWSGSLIFLSFLSLKIYRNTFLTFHGKKTLQNFTKFYKRTVKTSKIFKIKVGSGSGKIVRILYLQHWFLSISLALKDILYNLSFYILPPSSSSWSFSTGKVNFLRAAERHFFARLSIEIFAPIQILLIGRKF